MIHATSLPSCVELFLHFLSEENAKIGIYPAQQKKFPSCWARMTW